MEEAAAAAPEAVETAPEAPETPEVAETPEAEAPEAPDGRPALSWEEAMRRVPPDIAALMKGMQGDYTRKTQEVAQMKKDVLREREALQRGFAQVKPKDPAELGDFDPFNEASVQARIEAEVAKRLQEALTPMQREYELMAAEEAYQGFVQTHPDFETDTELRAEVQQALEANPTLDLETAYYAVQGRRNRRAASEATARAKAERTARRKAAVKGTGMPRKGTAPRKPAARDLKKMSHADILALAKELAAGR